LASFRKQGEKWRAEIVKAGTRTSKSFPTLKEAKAWALSVESNLASTKKHSGWTFGNMAERYKAERSTGHRTTMNEAARIDSMVKEFGEHTLLSKIDAPQIVKWRDKRLKTVTPSTVVREAGILRAMWRVAMDEWRWVEHYAFKGVKLPEENQPRHQRWTWPLIKRVLRAERTGKTAEMQAAFHIALRTGMRLSEVLQAPENFNPKTRVVTLRTKTETRAQIPIGRIAAKLLTRPPFVVNANEGSVLFSKLCRQLLIKDLTFHDARASALTWLSRKVDVMTLGKISRHKDLNLLQNVYYRETAEEIAKRI
jgi:integrase